MVVKKDLPIGKCERCDAPYPITRKDRRFCSDECSKRSNRPVKYKRVCPMCEKPFVTNAPRREFCSAECKTEARRAQFRAVVETVEEINTWQGQGLEVGRYYSTLKNIYDTFMVNGYSNEGLVWFRHRLDEGDLAKPPKEVALFADQLLDAIATTLEQRTGYRPITRLSVEHVVDRVEGS